MATPRLNDTASALLNALYPVKIIDEKAETAEEIAVNLGVGIRRAREILLAQIKAGKLEQVWKQGRIRLIPAYRVANKKAPAG